MGEKRARGYEEAARESQLVSAMLAHHAALEDKENRAPRGREESLDSLAQTGIVRTREARGVVEKLVTESSEELVLGKEDLRVLKDIFVTLLGAQQVEEARRASLKSGTAESAVNSRYMSQQSSSRHRSP